MRAASALTIKNGVTPTVALLHSFGIEHEWRPDQSSARTLDGTGPPNHYSALADIGTVAGWDMAQSSGANRPELVIGPPDSAGFIVANATSLEAGFGRSIDPNASFTCGAVITTRSSNASLGSMLSFSTPSGLQRFLLGWAGSFPLMIWRRHNDAATLTQCLAAPSAGTIYVAGKLVVSAGPTLTMTISINGAAFADAQTPSGTFTNAAMRAVLGNSHTSSTTDPSDDKLRHAWCTQSALSDADIANVYSTLHAVYG